LDRFAQAGIEKLPGFGFLAIGRRPAGGVATGTATATVGAAAVAPAACTTAGVPPTTGAGRGARSPARTVSLAAGLGGALNNWASCSGLLRSLASSAPSIWLVSCIESAWPSQLLRLAWMMRSCSSEQPARLRRSHSAALVPRSLRSCVPSAMALNSLTRQLGAAAGLAGVLA
jgi:hypothetical protein